MKSLDELLGEEYRTPEARLYLHLAREHQDLLADLIAIRKATMTQDQVAQIMGVSQATVSAFERLGNDPKLSTVRRYAKAVRAMIRHQVDPDVDSCDMSESITHFSKDGVHTTKTSAARARRLADHLTPFPEKALRSVEEFAVEEVLTHA